MTRTVVDTWLVGWITLDLCGHVITHKQQCIHSEIESVIHVIWLIDLSAQHIMIMIPSTP